MNRRACLLVAPWLSLVASLAFAQMPGGPPDAPARSANEAPPSPIAADAARRPGAVATLSAPSADQFAKFCAHTEDSAECGKKIEAAQFARAGGALASVVKRDGDLLAVLVPGEPPFLFADKPGEAGPNYSFFAYDAAADAVVLYRARADVLDFVLVHRPTHSTTDLPNEPLFNSDGRYFVTADFCKEGCENRVTVWRFERRGPARERQFAPRTAWSDAGVSWGAPRRLIIDYTESGRSGALNLDLGDPRWMVLLP